MLQRPVEPTQFTSVRYGERLAEIGATPSIGTVADSCDSALAETINGCYKTELIYRPTHPGPWKSIEEVELAILGWVHWYNDERIHIALGDVTPAGFEAMFYAASSDPKPAVAVQKPESPPNPERLTRHAPRGSRGPHPSVRIPHGPVTPRSYHPTPQPEPSPLPKRSAPE